MKKNSKNNIVKTLSIALLIIGGGAFFISLPKIFSVVLVKTIDWLVGGTDPQYDSEGKMIYQDDRHTIASFGKRNEFNIVKLLAESNPKKFIWFFRDRDKNKDIDKIRFFTRSSSSPYVYTLGEKGYTKLNHETAEITQSKDISIFSKLFLKSLRSLRQKQQMIKKNRKYCGNG